MNEFFFLLQVLVLFNEHMFLLTIKEINKKYENSLFSELPQPWVSLHVLFTWCPLLEPWCLGRPRTRLERPTPSQIISIRNSLYIELHSVAKAMTMALQALVMCVCMCVCFHIDLSSMCFKPVLYTSSLQMVPRNPMMCFKWFEKCCI